MYKLLIVDDNLTHINFVTDSLDWNAMGFDHIYTARDGIDGLNKYNELSPDLIITDVAMPDMDGIEMIKQIRKSDTSTAVIFMSCYEDFNYVKASLDANAASYILKPINPTELETAVINVQEAFKTRQHLSDCFFYNILYSKQSDDNALTNLEKTFGFSNFKCMVMVKYVLLGDNQNYSNVHLLEELIKKEFQSRYHIKSIILSTNEIAVMFMGNTCSTDSFLEVFFDSIGSNLKSICENTDLKVAAGISKTSDSIRHAKTMLEQATNALNISDTISENELYFYEDSIYTANSFNISELKTDVYTLFENNTEFSIDDFMEKYFEKNNVYSANELNQICLSVVTITQLLFLERNISIDQIFDEPNIIWKKLSDFSSILNVKQWIKNFLIACYDFTVCEELSKFPRTVSAIKEFIDRNYATITSVSQIANELYISSGYAKNIFKKHTGLTISEYLLDVRMKNACRLLKRHDIKVYEVQEMVGYQSKAHFTEVFKRKTGKTPKEYQQNPN